MNINSEVLALYPDIADWDLPEQIAKVIWLASTELRSPGAIPTYDLPVTREEFEKDSTVPQSMKLSMRFKNYKGVQFKFKGEI